VTNAKRQFAADEYRERARASLVLAQDCLLASAREKHALAASTWLKLADSEDQRILRSASLPGSPGAGRTAP
jgi:hypothetical protein